MTRQAEDWSRATWLVVFAGIADAYLWGFDVDGRWMLRHGNPASGTLAILPIRRGAARARLEDAVWVADCLAFDHDAPVGILPWSTNRQRSYPTSPVIAMPESNGMHWYFRDLVQAFCAAAEIRFGESYCVRYGLEEDNPPGTDFRRRFAGREGLVALYAMAARQADVLSEYLCLYRVLEAADKGNGKTFAEANLGAIRSRDLGVLRVVRSLDDDDWVNAFEVYRKRALTQLRRLKRQSIVAPSDVAHYLYLLRNSLAHGKVGIRTADFGRGVNQVAETLPIVKLLARIAVEP